MTPRSFALACLPPTLWALCYVFAKPAIVHFPPLFMVALAYAISAVILLPKTLASVTPWWAMFAIAAFGGSVQSSLIFWGLKGLPASTAVLVVQSQVPFAILCAWVLCGERPSLRRMLGVGIVLCGIVLVAGAPEAVGATWPLASVLLGTLSWGVSQAMIRMLGRDDGPTTIGALTAYAALNSLSRRCCSRADRSKRCDPRPSLYGSRSWFWRSAATSSPTRSGTR
jgi:O-acetylserine/cysteine efflux transporter